ncbi:MAG: Type secretion system protein [Candidatus Berkelbacteria bacterium]|nr:Type secretion system protein [Candidatus Berkelbacteria bacterium]
MDIESKGGVLSATKKGFTLIEIMVVVFIIALMTTIIIVAFSYPRQNARDLRRISDLNEVAAAINRYYLDNGHFPGENYDGTCGENCWYPLSKIRYYDMVNFTLDTETQLSTSYLDRVPQDPLFQTSQHDGSLSWEDVTNSVWGYRFTCWGGGVSECRWFSLGTVVELEKNATVLTGTPTGQKEFRLFNGKTCYNMNECSPPSAPGTGQ